MFDAQAIDIGVIGDALLMEVCAQICTVGSNRDAQTIQRHVVL